ncbi:MAG TPA: maltose alpha-D-glucosyltransferase [Pirellulales bacterium]|nr:maltose alpha-D-glucosyltransferase [Pirellulales bacterium]
MIRDDRLASMSSDPLWYKDAVIYELHVRAFYDHNGDGVGDFEGLTRKLDYLQDLGVTALWLLPFYPSPLKDDGYDIADYTNINPTYGTLRDFRTFLREAHRRGLRVITEMVLNHTSDQHHWFQRSREARPGSSWRDFYVWSETPNKYQDARIIFKDFETSNWTWDAEANAYYWHRFYRHQPDLNYDNPRVKRALFQVLDRWLEMGVDGMRLDAVPYLYEREGTNCENLPETHAFLRELRRHIDDRFPGRMLLAEANQWPEDAIAYFGDGDECNTAFHFPLMPRLFMATQMEDRFPIIDIVQQTPAIHPSCQWALFLRNHDELTLEMVTDEERDYMYRVYAHERQARINLGIRRRLAPLLGNNRRKMELMNGLLFSMPGTPVIYYGDEIGMGDNIYLGDRDGVRTPMQWSADRNAGFSRANPQRLYLPPIIDSEYHFQSVNVETQRLNSESFWWWMKRLIALRQRHPVFGRGTLEFLFPDNPKVLAFVRSDEHESVLVVANLSRNAQCAELDLSEFEGMTPIELLGRTEFPPIGKLPYFLTMNAHAFYWFQLTPAKAPQEAIRSLPAAELPLIRAGREWTDVLKGTARSRLENALRDSLRTRRWFGGKARQIQSVQFSDSGLLPFESASGPREFAFTLLRVDYTIGEAETYLLPMCCISTEEAEELQQRAPQAPICRLQCGDQPEPRVLVDAVWLGEFADAALDAIERRRRIKGSQGEFTASPTRALRRILGQDSQRPAGAASRVEQSNTSIAYGDQLMLKVFRRVESGVNPDLAIGRYLREASSFDHSPPVAGWIEYVSGKDVRYDVGILHAFVPNQGTAWQYTLETLQRYFEEVAVGPASHNGSNHDSQNGTAPHFSLVKLAMQEVPAVASERLRAYQQSAELLGRRTAELHLALAENRAADFAPEAFTQLYQRSEYQSMRKLSNQTLQLLHRQAGSLPEHAQRHAREVMGRESEISRSLHSIMQRKLHAERIRTHGDYHLGQVLYTGNDFVIIDFEGEPARSLSERSLKRSPLRDVASMLRSFHYAAHSACFQQIDALSPPAETRERLLKGAAFWSTWASVSFLKEYLATAEGGRFLPINAEEIELMLNVFLLEKAIYELKYELNNRPDWVEAPLLGILDLLNAAEQPAAATPTGIS